jgi:hypothetical protein
MLVLVSKEILQILLEEEIKCWESLGGGPNVNAFTFDPKKTDPKLLRELGYYEDREAWIAGARIKELRAYIDELEQLPQYTGK